MIKYINESQVKLLAYKIYIMTVQTRSFVTSIRDIISKFTIGEDKKNLSIRERFVRSKMMPDKISGSRKESIQE